MRLPELVSRIISFIADGDPETRAANLMAASLVSRMWLVEGHAQRQLFAHPTFPHYDNWERFAWTLKMDPRFRPDVKTLRFHFVFDEDNDHPDELDWPFYLFSDLKDGRYILYLENMEISALLPDVHTVECKDAEPPFLLLSFLKSLKTLTLRMSGMHHLDHNVDIVTMCSPPSCALAEFNLDCQAETQSFMLHWLSKTSTAQAQTLCTARLGVETPHAATEIQEFVRTHASLGSLALSWPCTLDERKWQSVFSRSVPHIPLTVALIIPPSITLDFNITSSSHARSVMLDLPRSRSAHSVPVQSGARPPQYLISTVPIAPHRPHQLR
jgi:hypothetical protein